MYKLGITVQDLVNHYCSGFPASSYEIFNNISYNYKSTLFKKPWSSCLRHILNCSNVTGAPLGSRNRMCPLGGLRRLSHGTVIIPHHTSAGSWVFHRSSLTAMTDNQAACVTPMVRACVLGARGGREDCGPPRLREKFHKPLTATTRIAQGLLTGRRNMWRVKY